MLIFQLLLQTHRSPVATRYRAITSVAGDFYEFLQAENGGLGLLVVDVSGHGRIGDLDRLDGQG